MTLQYFIPKHNKVLRIFPEKRAHKKYICKIFLLKAYDTSAQVLKEPSRFKFPETTVFTHFNHIYGDIGEIESSLLSIKYAVIIRFSEALKKKSIFELLL